jgi:hypothetical protein
MAHLAIMALADSMALLPHPLTPAAGLRIDARAERFAGDLLQVNYVATGEGIQLAAPAQVERADELWKATCFEAFVMAPEGPAYLEMNLAPSRKWALYAFDTYRHGMRSPPAPTPEIEIKTASDRLELAARIELSGLAPPGPWRVALTAVVERTDGAKSYWSLAHPEGKPDFHNPAGFVLTLPEPV